MMGLKNKVFMVNNHPCFSASEMCLINIQHHLIIYSFTGESNFKKFMVFCVVRTMRLL